VVTEGKGTRRRGEGTVEGEEANSSRRQKRFSIQQDFAVSLYNLPSLAGKIFIFSKWAHRHSSQPGDE